MSLKYSSASRATYWKHYMFAWHPQYSSNWNIIPKDLPQAGEIVEYLMENPYEVPFQESLLEVLCKYL